MYGCGERQLQDVTALRVPIFEKAQASGQWHWLVATLGNSVQLRLVCPPSLPVTWANPWDCALGIVKGLGSVNIVVVLRFRSYWLGFKANCGISFFIPTSPHRDKMRCPHKATVQGPCQLACANTLLSNDLICNKAKSWCSSRWHRMPGEVTKLLYVPLALAAMVNSPAAFMQMPLKTLQWLCQEAGWQAV